MPDRELVVSEAAFELTVFLPISASNQSDLRSLGCAVYVETLTTQERQKLINGTFTVEEVEARHAGDIDFIKAMEDAALSCSTEWAKSDNPTQAVYYGGNLSVRNSKLGRIHGWVASHAVTGLVWIQANWEDLNDTGSDDNLLLDSCADEVTEFLPEFGTDIGPLGTAEGMVGMIARCGFVRPGGGPVD